MPQGNHPVQTWKWPVVQLNCGGLLRAAGGSARENRFKLGAAAGYAAELWQGVLLAWRADLPVARIVQGLRYNPRGIVCSVPEG